MHASKENCRDAYERLFNESMKPGTTLSSLDWRFLSDFLIAAERRLPAEAAIARDKARRTKA